jgi:hypothetical protein
MIMGLFCGAEEKIVEAGHVTLRWTRTDVIDDLGHGDRVLSGTITGNIFVKHLPEGSGPPQSHAGKMQAADKVHLLRSRLRPIVRPSVTCTSLVFRESHESLSTPS